MGFLKWLTRGSAAADDTRRFAWRTAWAAAAAAADVSAAKRLQSELDALGCPEEEIEIEREMLDALADLQELVTSALGAGLPVIPTGHHIVAMERCYFSAPVSM